MADYDIVVIGGGSGGLVVASAASQLKARVALVEKDRLGGDCLWYGCVPSKALIHAARTAYEVKIAPRFGIYPENVKINFVEVIKSVQEAIRTIEPHDSPDRFRSLGVEVIFGSGEFLDSKTFAVNDRKLTARAFVIATGSRPAIPDIPGLQKTGYITNEEVFSLAEAPKSLAVIGSGPIGCELGQAFHRLGIPVTILSRSGLLVGEEPDAVRVIEEQFRSEGIRILHNARIDRVEKKDGDKIIYLGEETVTVHEILVAAGRQPNVDSVNLTAAGVNYSERGIRVNSKLQTSNPRIYAIGDVIGGYRFTHVAGYEAGIVIPNALIFPFKKADYRVIPRATFTDPELARVGMTETEAREKYGDAIAVLQQPFAGVDRAVASGRTEGFAKIITRSNGEILGASIVGSDAGELLHEIILAMRYKLKVSALTGIHIYPTLSEVNSKAGLLLTKRNYAANERLQKFLETLFRQWRSWNL
jgi:pyruvate/2-oxoglutarate dehydrogenase complex dihydrolipoamide dehydrogenase (E3) component